MNETVLREVISSEDSGIRIDSYITERVEKTRSFCQKLIDGGKVTLNGKPAKKSMKLTSGDIVTIMMPEPESCEVLPEDIPLDIVYEDKYLIVINKPKGMVVHPAPGNPDGTLVNALLYHCGDLSGINGILRPGIVHRIDRDTSGLLVAAKTDAAHVGLARQLECHSMERAYNTVLVGGLKNDSGTVTTYIGRSKNDRKKMAVVAETDSDARRAVTHYTVFERVGSCTYAEMRLETGRTHQIRVHMSYLGHPVLGDPVYGGMSKFAQANEHILNGQCLHARTLGFEHPVTGENMRFDSGLPEYFTTILEKLRAIG